MALTDDIDDIKTNIGRIALALAATEVAIQHLSDKIDGIKPSSNANTRCDGTLEELTNLIALLAAWKKKEAIHYVQRLTGCTVAEATNLVGMICH